VPATAELATYAAEVARRVRAVLDGDLVGVWLIGVWLIGSAALDDFDAQRSGVDVLAVSAVRRRKHAPGAERGARPPG